MVQRPKRVALYVRVSTSDQSTELQKRELLAYTAARGWNDYGVYDDTGKSGTTAQRVQLRKLMEDCRQRRVDVVVCWKLDRLFRSLKDLIATLQEFSELGVAFISIRDHIDLTTSSGRLMMHMLGAFAEFEGSLIRERVKSGLLHARSRGKRLGRPPKAHPQLDRIVALRASGRSLRAIAAELGMSVGSVVHALRRTKKPSEKCA